MTTAPTSTDHGGQRRKLAGIVLGLTTVIALMVLAFAAPALNSGAKDLPLAVSGPEPAVARLTSTLETGSPGTFEVTAFDSAQLGVLGLGSLLLTQLRYEHPAQIQEAEAFSSEAEDWSGSICPYGKSVPRDLIIPRSAASTADMPTSSSTSLGDYCRWRKIRG